MADCPRCDTPDVECTSPGCCDHCVTLGHAWAVAGGHVGFWAGPLLEAAIARGDDDYGYWRARTQELERKAAR